ncbi:hypothetical protein [Synechococcus phage BUCT-ZZ01]|nr:hypothetical protein [Synechococcus phage BUCT-ZZ01]
MKSKFITVRTEKEGFHFYPNAGSIDPRIKFLENEHRHLFKIELTIQVWHDDRELEFFLIKWELQDFINKQYKFNHKSCEMIADDILEYFKAKYGDKRNYFVTVSEDGESDGSVVWHPEEE